MQKAISLKEKYPLPLSPTICIIMYFIINFQELLVVCRNACRNAEREFFVAPPPSPVPAVKEALFVWEIRNHIPRAVRHAFRLFQLMYHTQLSSVRLLRDVRHQGKGKDLLDHTPIRSVDSSISEITATPVAPYPPSLMKLANPFL